MAAKKKLNSGVEIVLVLVLLTCAPSLIHSADDNRLLVNMTLVPNSTASALGACSSAGGLAVFLHCDDFINFLPRTASVKCLSDGGFFLDVSDIALNHTMRSFYKNLVQLQGVEQNLNPNCTKSLDDPELCFFPQYALKYIETPFFVLNSAYDVFQFHHGLAPPSADKRGDWNRCSFDPAACNANQIDVLQGFRNDMLAALPSRLDGMFINSCFAHGQSESQDTWFADDSPRIHDKGIEQNLNPNCTKSLDDPELCFFPQYALKYIETPFFVLNSAYDVFQFHHGLAPPSADKRGDWNRCSFDPAACNANQIDVLQGFRNDMLAALHSRLDGMFVNSCFAHCQSESQDTWFADDSPRIHDKTIAEAVGDWYYNRRVTKEIDCPYPCDSSCHNIIP
ncbi:hypothetical protein LWI29_004051 [Acer saccharum]|uniref:Pectin acetylesterase n=1 Tax=Acer saccharum TaxID=4024 RepID=A0AA39SCF4_ACESA|nr:hypothetical protein LWI29_004051 [Acer saccharum]